jgi:hypothetical protein
MYFQSFGNDCVLGSPSGVLVGPFSEGVDDFITLVNVGVGIPRAIHVIDLHKTPQN